MGEGDSKRRSFSSKKVINNTAEIAEFINKKASKYLKTFDNRGKNQEGNGEQKNDEGIEDIVFDVLLDLTEVVPFAKDIKWVIDTALNLKDLEETYGFKKWFLEKVDMLDNRIMRQGLFLNELIEAMSDVSRRMIVLDNFQMDPNNELGRDHTWLTTNGKLFVRMDAFWIIVSRRQIKELFLPLFGEDCEEQKIFGFTKEMAERYLVENCFDCEHEFDYIQVRDNFDNEQLIKKMLEVCDFNEKGDEKTFLPYLLRLVVLYYWNLREDRTVEIKPELFAKLHEQDDFVGFYFYKDLSDLMINAFQILSCLSAWDSVWIQKVREKFDNHLLNARNLLEHKAPIEHLENDSFKLHEALKDGLYRNGQNYIKKDVLGYLFDSFINIYGNNNLPEEDRNIWYQQKKIETFIEVVFEYINLEDERKNRKKNLGRIRPAVENIYAANCKRGSVSSEFIRMYCGYIDKLGEVMDISFVKMHNNVFDKEEIVLDCETSIPDEEKQKQMIYYMQCCFKLADLYTNITQNGIAWRLERLCILFWESQMKHLRQEQADYRNKVWYYRCWQQKVKAVNSTAYDYSAEHQYEMAYELGKEGLESAYDLGNELLSHIKMGDEEKEILSMLLKPDENPEFFVSSAYTEIPFELHQKMKRAYLRLLETDRNNEKIDENNEKTDTFGQVLYDLMVIEQQNLRGNYPWYCIHNPKLMKQNEISEKERRKEACRYGVRTYWMRRVLSESAKDDAFTRKMLISYHNICVYLSKCGEYEKACLLEKEVLEETLQMVKKGKLTQRIQSFLDKISGYNKPEIQRMLWENENLDSEKGKEFFLQSDDAIERMQYLGDYYLQMGYYSLAQKWLSKVMLMRSVALGAMDGKTLDTVIRFYVALYANQKKETSLLKSLQNYVEDEIFRSDVYIQEWQNNQVSKGLWDKFVMLKKIINIGNEGIRRKSQEKALVDMLSYLEL